MVAQQEAIVRENNMENVKNILMMIKGKRTKRAGPLSPLALTMSTSAATGSGGSGLGSGSASSDEWAAANSTASEEEEDMAHCLILLAQGSNQWNNSGHNNNNKNKVNNGTTSYECKTCDRSFPSFQALGGHRASHKKPKLLRDDYNYKTNQFNDDNDVCLTLQMANTSSTTTAHNNIINTDTNTNCVVTKVKVHECGTCGAEFSSGQALGGHMRRHRPIGAVPNVLSHPGGAVKAVAPVEKMVATTRSNVLSLDLNLPAPEEDQFNRHFVFTSNDKTLVFTASSLVDCHY